MPHPTPPHHQRSIKNLRLEKEAFRDLSFRSVGKKNIYWSVLSKVFSWSLLFCSKYFREAAFIWKHDCLLAVTTTMLSYTPRVCDCSVAMRKQRLLSRLCAACRWMPDVIFCFHFWCLSLIFNRWSHIWLHFQHQRLASNMWLNMGKFPQFGGMSVMKVPRQEAPSGGSWHVPRW